ncbi:hypothetical protein SNE40_000402 [Patella caerulea]|uniref:Uncharacterized protein n=1 Tax=Patella caerulea TaxID=87958 RepID=A0AAN8QGX7_PATCE
MDEQQYNPVGQSKPVDEQPYSVDMSSLIVNRATRDDEEEAVESFSIEPHIKNTKENRNLESNTVFPYLVRRVDSEELLPRPWKSTNQLIIVSYISVLFCCFFGVFANHNAWEAKEFNNRSRYHEAKGYAKHSVRWMYAAFVCGIVLAIGISVIVYLWPG